MPEWEYRKFDLNDPPREATDLDLLEKAADEGYGARCHHGQQHRLHEAANHQAALKTED
jgi:hypothetical protein